MRAKLSLQKLLLTFHQQIYLENPPQVVDFSSNLPPAANGIFNSSQLLQFDCGGYFSRKLSTSADVLAQWVSHLFALLMHYLCLTRELLRGLIAGHV